jgi:preprotein translocase subunit SecE
MANDKTVAGASFWQDLFHLGVYKRNQGRIVRQVTFAFVFAAVLIGAWQLWAYLQDAKGPITYLLPGSVLFIGTWLGYRLVNYPRFADFLIAVEAEMNKVSWPSRTELVRSAMVVMFLMFFLTVVLFGFDLFWQWFFQLIGVLQRIEVTS